MIFKNKPKAHAYSLVEMVAAVTMVGIIAYAVSMLYATIRVTSSYPISLTEIPLQSQVIEKVYGNNHPGTVRQEVLATHAPSFMNNRDMLRLLYFYNQDMQRASAIFCLPRTNFSNPRLRLEKILVSQTNSPNPIVKKINSTEDFIDVLKHSQNLGSGANIFSAYGEDGRPLRGDGDKGSVYFVGTLSRENIQNGDTGELPINAIYEIDSIAVDNQSGYLSREIDEDDYGTLITVRRFQGEELTLNISVFYSDVGKRMRLKKANDSETNNQSEKNVEFAPVFFEFKRQVANADNQPSLVATAIKRRPFYLFWVPEPATPALLEVSNAQNTNFVVEPLKHYKNMAWNSAFTFVTPMFPSQF